MSENKNTSVIANEKIDNSKLTNAAKIILRLQQELKKYINKGYGPFMAAVYDDNGNLIARAVNSVVDSVAQNHR